LIFFKIFFYNSWHEICILSYQIKTKDRQFDLFIFQYNQLTIELKEKEKEK